VYPSKFGTKRIFEKIEIMRKIENLVKNPKFGEKSKIWSKINNLGKKIF